MTLSQCKGLFDLPGATTEELGVLKRQTRHPQLDFVVVPLEPDTVAVIFKQVEPGGQIAREIIHIQIEKAGGLLFGAYDNFHPDGFVVWEAKSEASIKDLQAKGILRSYQPADQK